MKIVIVGGTGFVGQHIASLFQEKGYEVSVTCRTPRKDTYTAIESSDAITILPQIDVQDRGALEKCFAGADLVINLAGLVSFRKKDAKKLKEINTKGALNVLHAVQGAGVGRFIHVSSTAALGFGEGVRTEESGFDWSLFPSCVYSRSKAEADKLILKEKSDTVILYPPLILGPGDNKNTRTLLTQASKGRLVANPPGRNSFVDVRDFAQAVLLLVEQSVKKGKYIVATENHSMREFNAVVAGVVGRSAPSKSLKRKHLFFLSFIARIVETFFKNPPLTLENIFLSFQERKHSSEKIKSLGWKPHYLLKRTLEDSWKWMQGEVVEDDPIADDDGGLLADTVFVTGAAGCLGSSLAKRLVELGKKVHILILPGTWHPYLDGLDVKVFEGDIRNREDVLRAMRGCGQVYQVAGVVSYNLIKQKEIYTTHVDGVRTVLQAAKDLGVEKVVVTASTAGIGIPEKKEHPLDEKSPFDFKRYTKVMYMYSKHLTIGMCEDFAENGLNVCAVSPTTIYGQGDITMHFGKIVKKIKEGVMKIAPPGGNAVISVDDTVDAHLLAMEKGRAGENYVVADEFIPYLDMFNRIAVLIDRPKITNVSPSWILPFLKGYLGIVEKVLSFFKKKPLLSPHSINFSFKHRYFNSAKARRELGWEPKVSFEESVKKALAFYEQEDLL